jgi:hypothetical protein
MKLVGTCQIRKSGLPDRACIEFDLSAQTISVWLPPPSFKEIFTIGQHLINASLPIVNIEVVSPAGILCCETLPPSFVSSVLPSGFSADDGEINKIIAAENERIQGTRLCLTLRRSRVSFSVKPFVDSTRLLPETMFTNHSPDSHCKFDVQIGKRHLEVRYSPKYVFVRGEITNSERDLLRYTCSLLSLGPEQIVAQVTPTVITLNVAWATSRAYGQPVVSTNQLPQAFQSIVSHLTTCGKAQQEKRFDEITCLVGGFQQSLYVEFRLSNLLMALESFDGTNGMDANRISKLLGVVRGDADFICRVRNHLSHDAMPLREAALKAHSDLSSRSVSMRHFARLPKTHAMPWRLYVTFARLIVSAFFRECGVDHIEKLFSTMKGF